MPMIDVGSCFLNVRTDGPKDGRCVMFANALGTDLRVWDPLLPHLPQGLRIIRYDKRGHGLSDCHEAPYSIETLACDAGIIADALGARHITFVGLSIGGLIGQGLCATRPELSRSLVLMDTGCKIGSDRLWLERNAAIRKGGLRAIADGVMERWFCAPMLADTAKLSYWRNMLCGTSDEGYIGCSEAIRTADFSELQLALPIAAMVGDQDVATPPERVAATAAHYGAPCTVIGNAGHLPCVEQPEAVAKILIDFLEKTSAA